MEVGRRVLRRCKSGIGLRLYLCGFESLVLGLLVVLLARFEGQMFGKLDGDAAEVVIYVLYATNVA